MIDLLLLFIVNSYLFFSFLFFFMCCVLIYLFFRFLFNNHAGTRRWQCVKYCVRYVINFLTLILDPGAYMHILCVLRIFSNSFKISKNSLWQVLSEFPSFYFDRSTRKMCQRAYNTYSPFLFLCGDPQFVDFFLNFLFNSSWDF